jgi:hypothetical protein
MPKNSPAIPLLIFAFLAFTSFADAAIVINEVLAFNRNAHSNSADYPDVIELFNTGLTNVDIGGYSITDDPAVPTKYTFPGTTIIAAGGSLIIYADKVFTAPGLHTGFGLNSDGDRLLLFNGPTTIDSVTFGPQAPDLSIGRIPNGSGAFQANVPTIGTANVAQTLGAISKIKINEYMANPAYGDDWFEIHNTDTNPVSIAGIWLSDTPTTPKLNQLPPLSFIAGKGFQKFIANDATTGGIYMKFQLRTLGDSIVLTQSNGTSTIDRITFGTQSLDVSQGRLPDGAATIVSMPESASPQNPNYRNNTIVINEVLANSSPPLEDAIELFNRGTTPINVGGWWLSDDLNIRQKFQIPANTIIPPAGFLVIYENQMQAGLVPFNLLGSGDEVFLSAVDGAGNINGFGALVRFGPATSNTSIGRVVASGLANSSGGAEFWRLSSPSFGQDNAPTTSAFRTGSGLANQRPRFGPITINEVMYHSPDINAQDDFTSEFIELYNISNASVDVSGWRLKGDIEFILPSSVTIPARGFILLVSFDPSVDTSSLAQFRNTYGLSAGAPAIYGPYSPNLSNANMSVEFASLITIDSTLIFANMDKVEYRDLAPWPTSPDGTGHSLQRSNTFAIGNTASNWTGATPTPGAVNRNVVSTLLITTPSPLKGGVVGVPYLGTLEATDGFAPFSWTNPTGALPNGITLNPNGQLSGTPNASGTFQFNALVTDARGFTQAKSFSMIIAATMPVITSNSPLPNALNGAPFTQTLAATGGTTPYTWSILSGALPAGITLNSNGLISGIPAEVGSFNLIVQMIDAGGLTLTKSLALTIDQSPITIATSSLLPGAVRSLAYIQTLNATGGLAPSTWSLFSGSLPVGLSLNSNGTIAGIPTTPGVSTFTALLTDSNGVLAAKSFFLTVHATCQIPLMNPSSLGTISVGSLFSHTFSATNYPRTYSASGLPAGLTLNTTTGVVTGRPTVSGSFLIRVRATNSAGSSAAISVPLMVTPLPPNFIGTFTGLVNRDSTVNGNLGARLSLTITSRGTYTAKITRGATTLSAPVGYLNLTPPQLTVTIGGHLLSLTLDPNSNLLNGSHGTAQVSGWRSTWSKATPATNRLGYYSIGIDLADSGDQGILSIPQGSGFASLSVSSSGSVTVAGRASDGSPITTSGFIGPNGEIAIHSSLYSHRGSINGFLSLLPSTPGIITDNTITGTLTWLKPTTVTRTYKQAFGPVNLAAGGKYLAPSKTGFVILGLPAPGPASLDFIEAGTNPSGTNPDVIFNYSSKNTVTVPTFVSGANPAKTSLSINKNTGAISGTFTLVDTPPSINRSVRFQGLIVRPSSGIQKAKGYFLLPQIPGLGETKTTSPVLSGKMSITQ